MATCFTVPPTIQPPLALKTSLFPTPRPLITPASFSVKLQGPRLLDTACLGGANFKQGGRSLPSWRPRAVESDHETSNHPILQFVEFIRSFMFGDGDPNREANEERWKLIGEYITSKGGVVAAEELAPYLDPLVSSKAKDDDSHPMNDEIFMLPVLTRYDGHPVIDEQDGNVVYRFISLQPTPKELSDPNFVKQQGKLPNQKFFLEKKWQFSKTSILGKALIVGFCRLCWKGIFRLTEGLLQETPIAPGGYVKFFSAMLPVLQACVISMTTIPCLRFVLFCVLFLKRNADIRKRNLARERCARELESPDLALRRKLQCARDMAKRLTVVMTAGQEDMPVYVYGTDRTSSSTNSTKDFVEDI